MEWSLRTAKDAVDHYREDLRLVKAHQRPRFDAMMSDLRHMNLACFCKLCPEHIDGKPLGVVCEACEPCHVDVLLEVANAQPG